MTFFLVRTILLTAIFSLQPYLIKSAAKNQLSQEKKADSLAHIEKHKEAVEIYLSIFGNTENEIEDTDKNRLNLKAGNSLMYSGQYIKAMTYYRRVIKYNEKVSDNGLLNDAMTGIGRTYEYTGKHDSAFFWYMEAYKQIEKSDDTNRIARDVRNMAQLLRVLNRFNEARFYCSIAVDLIPGIKDHKVVANIYNETAYLFELSDELDSAAYYYTQLIKISIANNYLKGESVGYSNLASVYERQKKFSDALNYKLKGIEIDKEIDDTYGLMVSYRNLSSSYLLAGKTNKALETINQADKLCDTSWLPDMSGIKLIYYEIYKERKQYNKALEYYEAFINLRNRINQEESRKQVAELLTRYETEKKEQQIQLLEQANLLKENKIRMQGIIIGAMTLIGFFITLTVWLWIRNKNQKLRQMNMELQHFIIRQEQLNGNEENVTSHQDAAEIYKKWGLTDRESEILYYLGKGYSNKLIGEKLFISSNTVKFHIKNIYLKLDVKNRIQALLICNNNNNNSN